MSGAAPFVCRRDQVIANVRPAWAEPSRRRNPAIAGRMRRPVFHTFAALSAILTDGGISLKRAAV
jgi:hypothetical protein